MEAILSIFWILLYPLIHAIFLHGLQPFKLVSVACFPVAMTQVDYTTYLYVVFYKYSINTYASFFGCILAIHRQIDCNSDNFSLIHGMEVLVSIQKFTYYHYDSMIATIQIDIIQIIFYLISLLNLLDNSNHITDNTTGLILCIM